MSAPARLVLLHDPAKVAPLHPARPLTIGREANNLLCMPTTEGVAPHHAVVRFSRSHGWVVCDWGSPEGTWLEGQRIRHCRPLGDGDHIQLGPRGPVLVFQLQSAVPAAPEPVGHAAGASTVTPTPGPLPAAATRAATTGRGDRPAAASRPGALPSGAAEPGAVRRPARPQAPPLAFAGRQVPLQQILSAHVRSRARYPQSFSWWVLASLAGLVLLPWPWLFWPLEIGALLAWILLGSRKEHLLIITSRDGMAYRHSFASRITALSHRNGLRAAIGQSLERS